MEVMRKERRERMSSVGAREDLGGWDKEVLLNPT